VGRLRIAVPAEHARLDPGTGAGRVWHSVLPHLREDAQVRVVRRLLLRRPDVWLLPAHGEPVSRREPVVPMLHGAAWLLDPGVLDDMPREYAEPFAARTEATLARAAFAIVPSEFTGRALTESGSMPAERVAVVPLGVDHATFNPRVGGGRGLVAGALGEDRPYVLFAAIPTIRQKNLAALKEAMARLASAGLPHALAIAGGPAGGESSEELRQVAAGPPELADRVVWLGHVDDEQLAGLMAEADAFCLPSLYDAFPLTALEALACGAPAVFSNRGSLPEIAGDAAIVTEPDPDSLAEALQRVLSDEALRGRLRDSARARAEGFSWERTAQGWLDALERAAELGPRDGEREPRGA
jgi:glycosyltransferase involved in cell wall biosynthesis